MATASPLVQSVRVGSQVIQALRDAGIDQDDPDFETLVSSECDGIERMRRIIRAARRVEADAKALSEMIEEMQDRRRRLLAKVETLRHTAKWGLEEMGLSKLEAPDFTVTVGRGRPGVVITDEAAIPDTFCRIKREPSKTAIREALDAGLPVPGAELSNPQPVLNVRVR